MTKTKTSKKKLSLSERNKKFWAMTKPQQRVAIAKDVIKQLRENLIEAKRGTYFQFNTDVDIVPEKLDDLLADIKKSGGDCQVCGIGACFVGLVDMGNKIKSKEVVDSKVYFGEDISDDIMRRYLRKVFTPRQLTLIECAFEMSSSHMDDKDSTGDSTAALDRLNKESQAASDFGEDAGYNSRERLIAIMKNIIKNKGEFKP